MVIMLWIFGTAYFVNSNDYSLQPSHWVFKTIERYLIKKKNLQETFFDNR